MQMNSSLASTEVIESDHPQILELARNVAGSAQSSFERARELFYFVRETVKYNPFSPFFLKDHYRTTSILDLGRGYCVQKAVVLVTLARALGIPAQLVFADIRNYKASSRMVRLMGTNLFAWHGYASLRLGGKWVKVAPIFEQKLCEENGFPVVEFDGENDAVFPALHGSGGKFVEYVKHHGSFDDLPLDLILQAWDEVYGVETVNLWREALESGRVTNFEI
ncbi:MAG: transglutaminase family protein [Pseudomonadota bacterium]